MKEYKSKTGGRPLYNEDMHHLQELALSANEFLNGAGLNFVLSGCEISVRQISSTSVIRTVSAGYVFLNGKVRRVEARELGPNDGELYICEKNVTTGNSLLYADKTSDEQYIEYGAEVKTAKETLSGQYIREAATGTFPNIKTLFFKFALAKGIENTQSIDSPVIFTKGTMSQSHKITDGTNYCDFSFDTNGCLQMQLTPRQNCQYVFKFDSKTGDLSLLNRETVVWTIRNIKGDTMLMSPLQTDVLNATVKVNTTLLDSKYVHTEGISSENFAISRKDDTFFFFESIIENIIGNGIDAGNWTTPTFVFTSKKNGNPAINPFKMNVFGYTMRIGTAAMNVDIQMHPGTGRVEFSKPIYAPNLWSEGDIYEKGKALADVYMKKSDNIQLPGDISGGSVSSDYIDAKSIVTRGFKYTDASGAEKYLELDHQTVTGTGIDTGTWVSPVMNFESSKSGIKSVMSLFLFGSTLRMKSKGIATDIQTNTTTGTLDINRTIRTPGVISDGDIYEKSVKLSEKYMQYPGDAYMQRLNKYVLGREVDADAGIIAKLVSSTLFSNRIDVPSADGTNGLTLEAVAVTGRGMDAGNWNAQRLVFRGKKDGVSHEMTLQLFGNTMRFSNGTTDVDLQIINDVQEVAMTKALQVPYLKSISDIYEKGRKLEDVYMKKGDSLDLPGGVSGGQVTADTVTAKMIYTKGFEYLNATGVKTIALNTATVAGKSVDVGNWTAPYLEFISEKGGVANSMWLYMFGNTMRMKSAKMTADFILNHSTGRLQIDKVLEANSLFSLSDVYENSQKLSDIYQKKLGDDAMGKINMLVNERCGVNSVDCEDLQATYIESDDIRVMYDQDHDPLIKMCGTTMYNNPKLPWTAPSIELSSIMKSTGEYSKCKMSFYNSTLVMTSGDLSVRARFNEADSRLEISNDIEANSIRSLDDVYEKGQKLEDVYMKRSGKFVKFKDNGNEINLKARNLGDASIQIYGTWPVANFHPSIVNTGRTAAALGLYLPSDFFVGEVEAMPAGNDYYCFDQNNAACKIEVNENCNVVAVFQGTLDNMLIPGSSGKMHCVFGISSDMELWLLGGVFETRQPWKPGSSLTMVADTDVIIRASLI